MNPPLIKSLALTASSSFGEVFEVLVNNSDWRMDNSIDLNNITDLK
jgi:hypothetical protein